MALRVACVDWPGLGNAPKSVDEAKANAALIAAAPAMIDALNQIAVLSGRDPGDGVLGLIRELARIAIAKATGEQSPSEKEAIR